VPCPICGAKCKCKNVGEGGLCCSCHKHKPKKIMTAWLPEVVTPELQKSIDEHIGWLEAMSDTTTNRKAKRT
jgi:hypothetical protein